MFVKLFVVILLLASCSRTPDMYTVRLYVHANDAYSLGRFTETAEILQNINNFPPAIMLRAKAEYFSGDLEKAEKSCRRVLRFQPSSYEARIYLIRILREKDELPQAIKLAELLLADNPQDIRTLRLAAEFAIESGKTDAAVEFLDRAAELSAESAMVLLDRARLRWINGRGQDAIEDLSRARAMLPWDTPLLRSINNLENLIKGIM